MLRPLTLLLSPMLFASLALVDVGAARGDETPDVKIRIGTYDNRAIAIAYAPSRFNPVAEKMKAYKKAKADGDKVKVKELEAWGQGHQRQLHFQGFGRVPVDNLFEPLKGEVAKLARERDLAAIAMSCNFTGEHVDLIDITDELVKLFNPSAETLDRIRAIRNVEPVSLIDLAKAGVDK